MFSVECPAFARAFGALRAFLSFLGFVTTWRSQTPHIPVFTAPQPRGHSKWLLEPPLSATGELEGAVRAPARCPRAHEGAA